MLEYNLGLNRMGRLGEGQHLRIELAYVSIMIGICQFEARPCGDHASAKKESLANTFAG
jgi:hypothetical protein